MKAIKITIKIIACISLILLGLVALTNWRLNGLTIFQFTFTAEQIDMMIETAGDYIFWVYVVIIIFLFFRRWIKKK